MKIGSMSGAAKLHLPEPQVDAEVLRQTAQASRRLSLAKAK